MSLKSTKTYVEWSVVSKNGANIFHLISSFDGNENYWAVKDKPQQVDWDRESTMKEDLFTDEFPTFLPSFFFFFLPRVAQLWTTCEQQKLQVKLPTGEFRVTHFSSLCLAPGTESFMELHHSTGAGTKQLRPNTCMSGKRDQKLGPFIPSTRRVLLFFFSSFLLVLY